MNDPGRKQMDEDQGDENSPPPGPNLILAYSLIAVALLIAFAVAALIVWPFYKAR